MKYNLERLVYSSGVQNYKLVMQKYKAFWLDKFNVFGCTKITTIRMN